MKRLWRLWCAIRGHQTLTTGYLFLEGTYIEVASCARCGAGE